MISFYQKQKKYQENLKQKSVLEHQMGAITNCLIGAVGVGEKVEKLNYNKEDLLKLDLNFHIELFKESNETVEDLEKTLTALYIKIINVKFDLEQELTEFIDLYDKKRENFLSKYIHIPMEHYKNSNDISQKIINKLDNLNQDKNNSYLFFSGKKGLDIFSNEENDFLSIKKEIKLILPEEECIIHKVEKDSEYEFFIPLLLNKEP